MTAKTLDGIQLLADLPATARSNLAMRCRWRLYKEGEQVIDHLSTGCDVFFVASGRVEVVIFARSGRSISFDDLTAGQCFGQVAAVDGLPRSASVVAGEESLIACMAPDTFRSTLEQYPTVGLRLIRDMARIIRASNERIVELSVYGAPYRVQVELLRLARQHMVNEKTAMLSPAPHHNDIAARVSTTRETVARVFGDLTRQKLLRKAPGTLYVNDVPKLMEMVESYRTED